VLRRASLRTKLDVAFTSNEASESVRKFPKLSRDEILNDKDEQASTTVETIETKDAGAETKPGRTIKLKGELIIGKDSYLMKTEKVPVARVSPVRVIVIAEVPDATPPVVRTMVVLVDV
jgi:hypothetical protein